MNVPLYAAALIAFALSFLWFDVFLGYTLLLALASMAGVLAVELASIARVPPATSTDPYPERVRDLRRRLVARSILTDESITVPFVAVSWGIFFGLGPKSSEGFVGSGLTYPAPAAVGTTLDLVASGVLVLGSVVAGLWWRYATLRFENRWNVLSTGGRLAIQPIDRERRPLGGSDVAVSCQSSLALQFVLGMNSINHGWGGVHTPGLAVVTRNGPKGELQRRFPLCPAHLDALLRMEITWGRPFVARAPDG